MLSQESHLSDQDLLLVVDGEMPAPAAARAAAHLAECWPCRARKQEIEEAIHNFVRFHQSHLDPLLPPASGARALLKARLAAAANVPPAQPGPRLHMLAQHKILAALFVLGLIGVTGYFASSGPVSRPTHIPVPVVLPEPNLTPGAVATVNRDQVCRSDRPNNRVVPISLQRRVFEEYGISAAEPRAYEVDYLITPALGGAEDIRNLWPQSYSPAMWNARVKDSLEDRLRELVCEGNLDLAAAQRDISSDWIAAYKKIFPYG